MTPTIRDFVIALECTGTCGTSVRRLTPAAAAGRAAAALPACPPAAADAGAATPTAAAINGAIAASSHRARILPAADRAARRSIIGPPFRPARQLTACQSPEASPPKGRSISGRPVVTKAGTAWRVAGGVLRRLCL